ncbi:hypothetical protein [Thalassovita mangrovi]|uniref:Uncharacterized protein n=1 Tax=Thalassovita mangrovi TaxID=2692236 RepID=A0A6L8LSF5_9RHOB|nr:hypothetical protein [Thalassovita mangrovi]MYM57560.1 hypothetical protein [Thalassovita mangrovi]
MSSLISQFCAGFGLFSTVDDIHTERTPRGSYGHGDGYIYCDGYIYQDKATNLSTVLNDPAIKNEATSIIRSLLSEIRLIPENGDLAIELFGELAGLLALSGSKNDESRPGAACSTVLVAGAGFEPATFRL